LESHIKHVVKGVQQLRESRTQESNLLKAVNCRQILRNSQRILQYWTM